MPNFHVLIEFDSEAHLSAAMRAQTERGVHAGPHGAVIEVVCDFHVEIFRLLDSSGPSASHEVLQP